MHKLIPITLTLALAVTPVAMADTAAPSEEARAQYEMGEYYYTQERDFAKAVECMTVAAEQGVPEAQTELGVWYYSGQGVDANIATAMEWWQAAADQGNTEAMRYLGYCYEEGEGVPANAATAVTYYKQAADLGDPAAMTTLGYCYDAGIGVAPDKATSVEYYSQAASAGDCEAQMMLGMESFEKGDYQRAKVYLQAAATQGEVEAQYTLGYMYANGLGVDKDKDQAGYWWKLAGKNGNMDAIMNLFLLNNNGNGYTTLVKGSTGEEVKGTQKALYAMGYLAGTNPITGTYDAATVAAVKMFQAAHGIDATGEADTKTRAAIDFQDLTMYSARVYFISLQNPDRTPRLFVSFENTGNRGITKIEFQVKPLDGTDNPMLAYDTFEMISCTSDRPIPAGVIEEKGYYWTLNGCKGVRGVKLAISSVTFDDGTVESVSDNGLNWVTYSNYRR